MIALFCGENSFARQEAYDALRAQHDPDGALATNTIVLQGARTSRGELEAAVLTVPFLADFRMVRVDGLGARLGGGRRRRSLGEWESLGDLLGGVPPTTVLVFLDDQLASVNPLRRAAEGANADVRDFALPPERELNSWVHTRARALGVQITPQGERHLVQLVGRDLWVLAGELEKLKLYAGTDVVDDAIVDSLVARSREGNIFQLVDAVAEGRPTRALHALERLRADGLEARRLFTMLARQYRMIAVAREILDAGGGEPEVRSTLSVHSFVAERAVAQARRYDQDAADAGLRRVLEAEVAVQNYWQDRDGGMNQEFAVELLISELARGVAI